MLTFYLVRHGNTEHNKKGFTMGHLDTPLTDEGLANAAKVASELKKRVHPSKNSSSHAVFDHVYSSDLGRAFITAHIIVEYLGLEKRLTRAKELREYSFGTYENFDRNKVKLLFPKYKKDPHFAFPEGESYASAQRRAVRFIKKLEKLHKGKTILIVTHSGVIRGIMSYFRNLPLKDHLMMNISHEYIGKFIINRGKLVSYKKLHS